MPATATVWEQELGLKDEALRHASEVGSASEAETVKSELADLPSEYESGITSVVSGDVFKEIDPQFPLLLKKQTEHRMTVSDLMKELALIVGMGDIKDPETSIFIYSLQLENPEDISATPGWKFIQQAASKEFYVELKNGYVNHDLLYELSDSDRDMVLLNVLQQASRVRLSLKPPWSEQRVDVLVEFAS
jgi:hypothetical protein